jgi:hypothetical protein
MVYIYVLRLHSNKYYIGKTNNPKFRMQTHYDSNGSEWTKKYKPITIHELIPDCDNFDEDKITIKYMEKYGIDNVRGGTFSQINLTDENVNIIKRMIWSSTDRYNKCGSNKHFVKDCKKSWLKEHFSQFYSDSGQESESEIYSDDFEDESIEENIDSEENLEEEYEEIWCCLYCGKPFETLDNTRNHENNCNENRLWNKVKKYGKTFITNLFKEVKCKRCGRNTHNIEDCYAKKHLKGYYLN